MRAALFTISGIAYGGILFFLGLLAAGAGHGVYIPIRLFSSPLWEIQHAIIPAGPEYQTIWMMTFLSGMVLLWGCAGLLSACLAGRLGRIALIVLLMVHYATVPFICLHGDWSDFPRVWKSLGVIVVLGFFLYLLGQAALWFLLMKKFRSSRRIGVRGTAASRTQ